MAKHSNVLESSGSQQGSCLKQSGKCSTEKRRAQQRLAQRAFRIREKEDISNLRKRVDELEKASDVASKAILTLCDKLLGSDLLRTYPNVVPALYNCLLVAKASIPEDKTEEVSPKTGKDAEIKSVISEPWNEAPRQADAFASVTVQKKADPGNLVQTTQNPSSHSLVLNKLVESRRNTVLVTTKVTDFMPNRHWTSLDSQMPHSFPISEYLSPKETSSFSRSLLLACYQNGYRMLIDDSTKLDSIKQVFGPLFTTNDRHYMVSFLQDAISNFHTHSSVVFDYGWNNCLRTVQNFSPVLGERLHSIHSGKEVIDIFSVQEMLRERGIATEDSISAPRIHGSGGSYVFDVRSFIAFLSELPVCSGYGNVVFHRYRFDTGLQLALVDYNQASQV